MDDIRSSATPSLPRGHSTPARSIDARAGTPITDCKLCPIGVAADVGRGGRCPLVPRARPAGACLYMEGLPAERVWFIKSGVVVLTRGEIERSGNEIAWAVRTPPSLIGLEALARPTYLDTARALSAVTLCGATRESFDTWLSHNASAARAVLDLVVRAQCADTPRRAGCDGSAVQRAARWVLAESSSGSARLPRRLVAQLLGMQPETFSRALATLAARGAIEVTRRDVRIIDREVLRTIIEGDDSAPNDDETG